MIHKAWDGAEFCLSVFGEKGLHFFSPVLLGEFQKGQMNPVMYSDYVGRLSDITYRPQINNAKGGVVVYMRPNANTNTNMRFQLQHEDGIKCRAPFGVSSFDGNESSARKSLELRIDDEKLASFFNSFDEHNINAAIANRHWFKKSNLTDEQIRSMYYPMITDESEKGYAPRLHAKVNTMGPNTLNVLVYTETNGVPQYEVGTMDSITRNIECMVILEATGLWFQNKQFGMTLLATDLLLFPAVRRECSFLWKNGTLEKAVPVNVPVSVMPRIEQEVAGPGKSILLQPEGERSLGTSFEKIPFGGSDSGGFSCGSIPLKKIKL